MGNGSIRRLETGFVGRASTMRRLDHWLSDALGSSPRLGLVIGEPGVGKSRLLAEWLGRPRRDPLRILAGSCHEDAEIPFLPLAAAFEQLPRAAEFLYPARPTAPATDLDARRYLGAARAVIEAAAHRPTVLVLHDVHWADPAALELVSQLMAMATRTASSEAVRLLVVLTARPNEGSARGQATLRRLRLDQSSRWEQLGGLDELEGNELLEQMFTARPARQFVRGVLDATNGNPLLISLLVDRLEREGHLYVRDGRVASRCDPEPLVVAADLEVAWRARLELLAPDDRALLELAALLGDDSSTDHLKLASALCDEDLDGFLERAAAVGLLSDSGTSYRFHHPHLRTAVVAAVPGRRRKRLEAQIATRLWDHYRDERGLHVLRIAQHARRSGSAPLGDDMAELVQAAAAQAGAGGMWGLAATYYEDALAAVGPSADPARRAVLELNAGQAHHRNQDFPSAVPHHVAAISLARQTGDLQTWGEALFWLSGANILERDGGGYYDDLLVSEFLECAGDDAVDQRALVLAYRAQHQFGRSDSAAGATAITEARRLARLSESADVHHFVAHIEGMTRLGTLDLVGAEDCFREAVSLGDDHTDPWLAVWPLVGLPLVHVVAGELDVADEEAAAAVETAADSSQWNLHGMALAARAAAAVGQGRLGDGRYFATLAVQSYQRSEFFYAGAIAYSHLIATRAYVGDGEGARSCVARWRDRAGRAAGTHALVVEALCGTRESLQAALSDHGELTMPSEPTLLSVQPALVAVEVGVRLERRDLLERAFAHLQLVIDRGVLFGLEWAMSVHRAMAQAAVALGLLGDATRLIEDAMEVARRASSGLEMARARVVRAQLGLAAGEQAHAVFDDLQEALSFFESAQMTPLVDQVRDVLPDAALAIRRDLVIVYTDLVESTRLNVSMGDALYVELLREHNTVVRERLCTYGGVEFTHTGDGIGARFASLDGALGFSIGLQERFDQLNERHPDFRLDVRVGVARGDAVDERGNLFGQTVVRAVRICACAGAGQVLVGEEIVALADPLTTQCHVAGGFALKGLSDRQELFEVRRAGPSDSWLTDTPDPRVERTGPTAARVTEVSGA